MCKEVRKDIITNTELEEVVGGVVDNSDPIVNTEVTTGYRVSMRAGYIKGVPGDNQQVATKPAYAK